MEFDQEGTKVKRGFFGRNEDMYGDMAGRYGFFTNYESPEHIRKRSQRYLDKIERRRAPILVREGIYTPYEQRIINMAKRNMERADEIEKVNKERRERYQERYQ